MHLGFIALESPYERESGGGIAAYLRAVIPELVSAGHRVTVIANSRKDTAEDHFSGALKIVSVHLPGIHWYLSKVPLAARIGVHPLREVEWSAAFHRVARKVFRDDPADVIETGETGAVMFGWRPIAPLVVRLHGSNYTFNKAGDEHLSLGLRWDRKLELSTMRHASAITSPSICQAQLAMAEAESIKPRIHVVPNPIALEMIPDAEHLEKAGSDGQLIVLYTGRLRVCKGSTTLIRAAREVRKKLPTAQFVFAGPWQMPNSPGEWGLSQTDDMVEGISWLGHLPWPRLKQWYRRASVFVMPSHYEVFGISVLEAMACGLPVVVSDIGGLAEIVEDGVTGIRVPPRDEAALRDAILTLLSDPGMRNRMGKAGRERVLASYTAAAVVRQMIPVYEKAMGCAYS